MGAGRLVSGDVPFPSRGVGAGITPNHKATEDPAQTEPGTAGIEPVGPCESVHKFIK